MKKRLKIGIIGFGNMGQVIAERLKSKHRIYIFDKDKKKTKTPLGLNCAQGNIDLVNRIDVLILAVKPQDFDLVLDEIKHCLGRKLLITIAAGITTKYIERRIATARVVRIMPNLPARVGKGMICISKGASATKADLDISKQLFKTLGQILVFRENMMNAVTAISGSGPGYFYDFIESRKIDYNRIPFYIVKEFKKSLYEAAKGLAFNAEQAMILANVTTAGSIAVLKATRLSPAQLKKQVVSRGGTTEAALEQLHKGADLRKAVKAAVKRAIELSKKE